MLLKFAYDGTYFYGYQRQESLLTVEGEILKVLRKFSISERIRSASRTDRGVSALGNVIWLKNSKTPEDTIGILNSNLKHIYFHSYALEDINPRHARQRWYRYHLIDFDVDYDRLKESAKIFEGEHNFKNFTRARKNTVLKIDSIGVNKFENIITIDFFAKYYLWNMLRRIVAAMEAYSLGMEFGEDVFEERRNFGLAEPHGLILMDVIYDFPFKRIRIKRKWRKKIGENYLSSLIYYYLAVI